MENMLSRCDDKECNMPTITCSIGCCIASKGDSFESVYKRADDALYEAKSRGKRKRQRKDTYTDIGNGSILTTEVSDCEQKI